MHLSFIHPTPQPIPCPAKVGAIGGLLTRSCCAKIWQVLVLLNLEGLLQQAVHKFGELNMANQVSRHAKPTEPLKEYRGRLATEPRDKIFALLGVCRWMRTEPLLAAYSKSVETSTIPSNAMVCLIAEDGTLSALYENPGSVEHPRLPTWVQDWSHSIFTGNQLVHASDLYDAGGPIIEGGSALRLRPENGWL
jgi:hypothetical protein